MSEVNTDSARNFWQYYIKPNKIRQFGYLKTLNVCYTYKSSLYKLLDISERTEHLYTYPILFGGKCIQWGTFIDILTYSTNDTIFFIFSLNRHIVGELRECCFTFFHLPLKSIFLRFSQNCIYRKEEKRTGLNYELFVLSYSPFSRTSKNRLSKKYRECSYTSKLDLQRRRGSWKMIDTLIRGKVEGKVNMTFFEKIEWFQKLIFVISRASHLHYLLWVVSKIVLL